MKTLRFWFVFLVFAACFCLTAFARTYTDDMTELDSNNIKQYSNLKRRDFINGASSFPDISAFTFENTSTPSAWAQYRVENSAGVSAGIYTEAGTFVSYDPYDPLQYFLGVFMENMSHLSAQETPQALFSRSTGSVYTYAGGGLKQAFNHRGSRRFAAPLDTPRDELIGYAVNFYHSVDGKAFTRAAAHQVKLQFDTTAMFYYEEYSASIPESAKYIRVEINDCLSMPAPDGSMVGKLPQHLASLASVTITGDKLTMGAPEAAVRESYPQEKSTREKGDQADKTVSIENESVALADLAEAEPNAVSSGASSKFEGIITPPSKSSASSQSVQDTDSSKKSGTAAKPAADKNGAETEPQSIIYEIPRGRGGNQYDGMISVYIVVVCVAGATAILLPRKK